MVFLITPSLVFSKVPDDPSAKQWAYEDIGLYDAWNHVIGSKDVVVAVIDAGFDTFHPDLRDNVWKNDDEMPDNGIDDDKNGYIDDVWGWNFVAEDVNGDGIVDIKEQLGNNNPRPNVTKLSTNEKEEEVFSHGTMVAGLIGARGDNNRDGVGVNWRVRLMNIKVIDNTGTGTLNELPRAIHYAVDNGADIINISMVSGDYSADIDNAVQYAYKKGVAVFAAAGNNSNNMNYFPSYPICSDAGSSVEMVMGVSAVTEEHRITSFSNTGSNCIDITAPGQNISSTIRYSPKNGLDKGYEGGLGGTSFATPLVAGAAALIKSIQPSWGPDKIFSALLRTVHHTTGQDEFVYANLFGAGLLQVDKAIKYVIEQFGPIHLANEFLVLGLNSGKVGGWDWSDEAAVDVNKLLIKVDDWAVYKNGGETRFFTIKRMNSTASQVTIYSDSWKKKKSWTIASEGKLNIAVGNVAGDDDAEVILSPQYPSDWIWRVYDQKGVEQKKYSLAAQHQGVSLDLTPVLGEEGARIVVSYVDEKGVSRLLPFDENLQPEKAFRVTQFKSRAELAVGDVDDDDRIEYVLSGKNADGSYVVVYNDDGKYKRKFKLSDDLGGSDVELGDYNKDGVDEIFTAPLSSAGQMSVWTYRGKKLFEWFPSFVSNGLKLLIY